MHKPFKKTHQNIRKNEDDVQSRTPRRKGGVSSEMTRLGQQMWNYRRNTAMSCFCLSEFYILQYSWWVGNTT